VRHISGQCNLREGDTFICPFDREFAIGKVDVGVTGLKQMGGYFLAFASILSMARMMAEPPTEIEREP